MIHPADDLPRAATVRDALASASRALATAGIDTSRLDAELLLAMATGADRTWLYTHAGATLAADAEAQFARLVARRARREPLAYIVGEQEFWSLAFNVSRDVLIPRPETELLVETALRAAARSRTTLQICDVGTGSGCIAIALASELPAARLTAVDTSDAALRVAERNARRHGVVERIRFVRSDLLNEVDGGFDVIASNPPYVDLVDRGHGQPELAFEPEQALYAAERGLEQVRRLLEQAPSHLAIDGLVLIEIGATQGAEAEQIARAAGFTQVGVERDLAGLPRLLVARR